MAMTFIFYSLLSILICLLSGMGLTIFFSPPALRKYGLFFAPLLGFCFITLLSWHFYRWDMQGTDFYAPIIMALSAGILFTAIWWMRKKRIYYKEFLPTDSILPVSVGIAAFLILSLPVFFGAEAMTSFSLGNNDIADTAAVARYLKEFARSDMTGFLGQAPAFKKLADTLIFGSSVITGFISSLLGLQTYQIQNLCIHVFFLFSVFMVYATVKELLQCGNLMAAGAAAIYGMNPMMFYICYHGFLSQMITMPLAMMLFIVSRQYLAGPQKRIDVQILSMNVLLTWGISITYPHMLFFIYAMIFGYVAIEALQSGKRHKIAHWLATAGLTLAITAVLSPVMAKEAVAVFMERAMIPAGWFIPWLPAVFKYMAARHPKLQLFHILHIMLHIAFLSFVLWGFISAYRQHRRNFWIALYFAGFVLGGYAVLSFLGRDEYWGGYKSFKWLSFFLPFAIMSCFLIFQKTSMPPRGFENRIVLGILAVFIVGCSGASLVFIKQVMPPPLLVTSGLSDLGKIEHDPRIHSVNILGKKYWDILWQTCFLMRKQLYFETSTYRGRVASELRGEWDLIQLSGDKKDISDSDTIIQINQDYLLKKRR
ncbi:hypothetical protein JW933_03210 [candidate division FCPU426 bacterium]|nr:hypothetical protein [candidate division FCPU426 bacterium]